MRSEQTLNETAIAVESKVVGYSAVEAKHVQDISSKTWGFPHKFTLFSHVGFNNQSLYAVLPSLPIYYLTSVLHHCQIVEIQNVRLNKGTVILQKGRLKTKTIKLLLTFVLHFQNWLEKKRI